MSVLTSGRVLPGDHALNEHALMRRITLRVVPLTVLIYLIAIIDRANVGFAKLQMVSDLHMTEQLYGLASSLFSSAICRWKFQARWRFTDLAPAPGSRAFC